MKLSFVLLLLLAISCQKNAVDNNTLTSRKKNDSTASVEINSIVLQENNAALEKKFRDSLYNCENNKFISVLEEIPNRDTNAYKLTITSKNGKKKITKVLDTRPTMSQINYCNDVYTVVGFPCGGPCYSQVFVFTDKNRPIEQYAYVQQVKNNPNFIAHIENEEFEKLIIHDFSNSKELIVDISDGDLFNYGQMDSLLIKKDNLILYYPSKNKKSIVKNVNLKTIF